MPGFLNTRKGGGNIHTAYVDGSYKNGTGGYGGIIYNNDKEVYRISGKVSNCKSAVEAELIAISNILGFAYKKGIRKITIKTDNKTIAHCLNNKRNIRTPSKYNKMVKRKASNFRTIKYEHIGRENNSLADELARSAY